MTAVVVYQQQSFDKGWSRFGCPLILFALWNTLLVHSKAPHDFCESMVVTCNHSKNRNANLSDFHKNSGISLGWVFMKIPGLCYTVIMINFSAMKSVSI